MNGRTKGQAEAAFSQAMVQFEKEYFGRGPLDAKTFFMRDMILVRLRGVLTLAEQTLAESQEGRSLVKETRSRLFESARPLLENMVRSVTGCQMISLHTDMSTRTGERIIVLIVDDDLEKQFV